MTTHYLNRGTKYHIGDNRYPDSVDKTFIDAYPVVGQAWAQPFSVSKDDSIEVVIEHLWGVDYGHNNIVYIGDAEIGRIEGHNNRNKWTSPGSWSLKVGKKYILKIASLGPGDPDDFVFEGIIIQSEGNSKVKSEGPPKILLNPGDNYWNSTYDQGDVDEACKSLVDNATWLYGVTQGDAKSFLLSPPADHGEVSKPITELKQGQFFGFRFQVVDVKLGGKSGRTVEILSGGENGSGWVFYFAEGKDKMIGGAIKLNGKYTDHALDTSWYKPGEYNRMILSFCRNGVLKLEINSVAIGNTIIYSKEHNQTPITVRAFAIDVVIDH